MTSYDLLQVAIENPKAYKLRLSGSMKKALITLYIFGRCYPVEGSSRGSMGYVIHDDTFAITSILNNLGVKYQLGNDAHPKNIACNYIELI